MSDYPDTCPNCGEPVDEVVPPAKQVHEVVDEPYDRFCQIGTSADEHAGVAFVHR